MLPCSGYSLACRNCHGGTAPSWFISVVSLAMAGARDMRRDNYGPPSIISFQLLSFAGGLCLEMRWSVSTNVNICAALVVSFVRIT